MTTDHRSPLTAPRRDDLPYLRRRSRSDRVAAVEAPTASQAVADFLGGKTSRHHEAVRANVSSSLDLFAPASAAKPAIGAGSAATTSGPVAAPRPATTPVPERTYQPPRVRGGADVVLTREAASLTLTRVQSGIGAVTIEAACSDAAGDLRLGCAYQLRDGATSVVQYVSGVSAAPPGTARPVIVGDRDQFERITLDLAQIRELDRFVVYAFSEQGSELRWGGTLVATTFGQAQIKLPMDRPASAGVAVFLSAFNVDGELVLRAEYDDPAATVRDACQTFGFDRIAWLDAQTPLV